MLSFRSTSVLPGTSLSLLGQEKQGKVHQNRKPEDTFSIHNKEGSCAQQWVEVRPECVRGSQRSASPSSLILEAYEAGSLQLHITNGKL